MELYNIGLSANALRVRAVAFELGIDLDIVEIDFAQGENRTDKYLAMNPTGKVPVLRDGDFTLWESRAINAYLAGICRKPDLYPADLKARAVVDQWSYWQAIHLGPVMNRLAFELIFKALFNRGDPDETAVAEARKELAGLLPVLDGALSDSEWIAGRLSIADFAMASAFIYRQPCGVDLAEHTSISAWIAEMEKRPSWQKATEPVRKFAASR